MEDIIDELSDRYGELPKAAHNLLLIALCRAQGIACGATSIKQEGNDIIILQKELNLDVWAELSAMLKGRLRLIGTGTPCVRISFRPGEDMLDIIHKIFEKYLSINHKQG